MPLVDDPCDVERRLDDELGQHPHSIDPVARRPSAVSMLASGAMRALDPLDVELVDGPEQLVDGRVVHDSAIVSPRRPSGGTRPGLRAASLAGPARVPAAGSASRGRGAGGIGRSRAAGCTVIAVAVMDDLERRAVEHRVGRLAPARPSTSSRRPLKGRRNLSRESAGGRRRREGERAVVVAHPAEAGDHADPRARPARRCAARRGCCARGRRGRSAPPRTGSRRPARGARPRPRRPPGCRPTATSRGRSARS